MKIMMLFISVLFTFKAVFGNTIPIHRNANGQGGYDPKLTVHWVGFYSNSDLEFTLHMIHRLNIAYLEQLRLFGALKTQTHPMW